MIPGKKVVAIFGFCDIRQFTDTTEVLQEGVMEFVNTIGKIVHMEVHLHGGSANKNTGDAPARGGSFQRRSPSPTWRTQSDDAGKTRGHSGGCKQCASGPSSSSWRAFAAAPG